MAFPSPWLSRAVLAAALLLPFLLGSCRTPDLVWNDDGHSVTDLATLRVRHRPFVELEAGVKLYADRIIYLDKARRTGSVEGRVFLDVEPPARYKWMVEHGYAQRGTFDRRAQLVSLAGQPMLEREMMTMVATADYTTMHVQWRGPMAHVHVEGPTRTDFAKSRPPAPLPPPGAFAARTFVPPAVAR